MRNKAMCTDKRSSGSLSLLFSTNVYFRKLQSAAEYTPGCMEQAPFMKRYQRAVKTEHLTNLKNRSIFGLCFGIEGKTDSAVLITPLTLKKGIVRECCESACPFGYK